MKKALLFIGLLLFLGNRGSAQSQNHDFVIVGAGTGDANLHQVQMRYRHKSNVYFIQESKANPIKQITRVLKGRTVQDLHIYLQSQPGVLIFNSQAISLANAGEFSKPIGLWKNSIKGKVVIHSLVAFTTPAGLELKQQLEKMTGLEFTIIR